MNRPAKAHLTHGRPCQELASVRGTCRPRRPHSPRPHCACVHLNVYLSSARTTCGPGSYLAATCVPGLNVNPTLTMSRSATCLSRGIPTYLASSLARTARTLERPISRDKAS
jgi:hypothetical protein